MLNNLRTRLPDIEEAREAALDRVAKTAGIAAQTAKNASGHLEEWAKDGLDSVKSRPLMWSAASLGFGALIGGLFAVWRKAKPSGRVSRRTVPARSRSKQILLEARKTNVAAKPARKKRAPKAPRPPSSMDA